MKARKVTEAKYGYFLSLVARLINVFLSSSLTWLFGESSYVLLILGFLIIIGAILIEKQRFRIAGSVLALSFSIPYIVYWFLITQGISTPSLF
ncbi:MAG: hypothetical protein OEX01_03990 [Candidatus Bathyarchaeota archaeon]|nr:hypothetical protein [Candidatus Bathyarchaeota archaeon]